MAVSIPIFTAQLRKARLATNQANARAAYAAATAALLDNTTNGSASGEEGGTYTYTVSTATVGTWSKYVAQKETKAISEWVVDEKGTGITLGNTVAKTWTVAISSAGAVSFSAAAD